MKDTNVTGKLKQTEIGLIPEDWEVKTLGDVLKIRHGKDQRAVTALDGQYPVFGTGGQIGHAKEYLYNKTSILIGRKGTIDKPMFVEQPFWTVDTLFYSELSTTVEPFLIFSILQLIDWYKFNEASGVPSLNARTIEKIIIPIPPKSEQTAIANALSDIDSLIAQTEKLIEKKKAIKQGMMQELLKPKEGWVTKKLGEIADIVGGGTPSTTNSSYWGGSINWLTPTEVGNNKYLFSSTRTITKSGLESCSAKILPIGTVVLTSRAGIGDLGILRNESATNQGFQSLIPGKYCDNEFLYYLMSTKKALLLQNASGSTFLEISPQKLKAVELEIPVIDEQKNIARILAELDELIYLLETKLKKLMLQKQGMMQQLLTGKIRLV